MREPGHTHTYAHTRMHTHMHTHMHTQKKRTHKHKNAHTNTQKRTHKHTKTNTQTHKNKHTNTQNLVFVFSEDGEALEKCDHEHQKLKVVSIKHPHQLLHNALLHHLNTASKERITSVQGRVSECLC